MEKIQSLTYLNVTLPSDISDVKPYHRCLKNDVNVRELQVCVLLARLFLTMSNPPSCFSSPNVLLPASLFGAGLAFCTLSVPMLRVYAAGVAGAALGLCAPAIFLQLCDLREKHEKWPNSCTLILCSVELGTCIFPLLFTEVSYTLHTTYLP